MIDDAPAAILLGDDPEAGTVEIRERGVKVGASHAACLALLGQRGGDDVCVSICSREMACCVCEVRAIIADARAVSNVV